jgi:recombination protein RecR
MGISCLLGSISPLEGKGPSTLSQACSRDKTGSVKEVISATDAVTEGETTSIYLTKLLKPLGVQKAHRPGIPVGSNLEYADATTLSKSLESVVRLAND